VSAAVRRRDRAAPADAVPVAPAVDDAALAELQVALLRAALHGAPLPGGAAAPALPDRALLPTRAPVPLVDEHLASGLAELLPSDVRVVAPAAVGCTDSEGGAHLRFAPPRLEGDALRLVLEVRLVASGGRPHPLGGLDVGFRRAVDGVWLAADAPRAFAT
jgi:hypothetical protein